MNYLKYQKINLTVEDVKRHVQSMLYCENIWDFVAKTEELVCAYVLALKKDELDVVFEVNGTADLKAFQHRVGYVMSTQFYIDGEPDEGQVLRNLKIELIDLLEYLHALEKADQK